MAGNKVLVVDDTAAHLQQMKEIVSAAGYQVITATSGREAIEKTKKEKPCMVFLDIVMDDLDGYGACREITRDQETCDIPVVFVSTKNQRADRIWAEKQGARALLTKPVDSAEIVNNLKMYL
ncbi:MAG: response regulator [Gammaproteobacteria bacterium]|nr:response regulator [Gammaproteobacteria bacterium]